MAPIPGDSSKHQFGTSMPQGGHPPHHSITSSARASGVGGTLMPSVLAVSRLMNSSIKVGYVLAFENSAGIDADLTERVGKAAESGQARARIRIMKVS